MKKRTKNKQMKRFLVCFLILMMILGLGTVTYSANELVIPSLSVSMDVERIDSNNLELTAFSTGGTIVEYRFDMRKLGTKEYTMIRDYDDDSYLKVDDVVDGGLYEIVVHAREVTEASEYTGYYTVFANVETDFDSVSFEGVDLEVTQEGNDVILEATANGGSNVIYQFVYSDNLQSDNPTYVDVRGYDAYSPNATFTLTDVEAGTYYFVVHACEVTSFPYTYYGAWASFTVELEEPMSDPQPTPSSEPEAEPSPAPEPEPELPSDSSMSRLTADEQAMFTLVNQERAKHGLTPLKIDMDVVRVARLKSQDMVNLNYFSHQSPTYGSPFDMMRDAGITYIRAGENLAGSSTVERAHSSLMNSPGHRANILNNNYTHVGIGIVDGSRYGKIFTQMFIQK